MKLFPLLMMVLIMSGKVYSLPAIFFIDSVKKTIDADSEIFITADVEPDGYDLRNQVTNAVRYPIEAQKANIEGTVIVKILLDFDGTIKKSKIIESPSDLFTQAVEALKKVKTNPAMQSGKPIQYWMTLPVRFALRDEGSISILNKKVENNKEFVDFINIHLSAGLERLYRDRSTNRVSGTISVSLTLKKDGGIDDVNVINSSSDYLEEVVPDMLEDLKLINGIFPDNEDVHLLKVTLNVTIAKED